MHRFRLIASLAALCMALPVAAHAEDLLQVYPVSYTHLTLPTIYSV